MTSTPYDQIARQFDAARVRFRLKEVEYLDLLFNGLETGGTILDLECETGHPIATHLASRGHHVVGVGEDPQLVLVS